MASNFEEQQRNLAQQGGLGMLPGVKAFDSGATRSADDGKNDYEGFLSFPALEEFGDYMTRHRIQPNGALRESDNWQKGIPITSYVKSLLRHVLELWGLHRGRISRRLQKEYPFRGNDMDFLKRETACAIFFNVQGFLHETLKGAAPQPTPPSVLKLDEVQAQFERVAEAAKQQKETYQVRCLREGEIPMRNGILKDIA